MMIPVKKVSVHAKLNNSNVISIPFVQFGFVDLVWFRNLSGKVKEMRLVVLSKQKAIELFNVHL